MDVTALEIFRRRKDAFFGSRDPHSPILPEKRSAFTGLRYFDPNPDLDIEVEVTPLKDEAPFPMQTSTGGMAQYVRYGRFSFEVEGEQVELTIYASPGGGGYFLPFTDATSGDETYGAGRYLDLEPLPDGRFHVDFNMAYNPYCAYNPNYSCPIPPAENRLSVPIRVGEKLPDKEWAQSY
jgi:uncharacterized protein (DUF1684 family)